MTFHLEQLTIRDITIVVHIIDPEKGGNIKNEILSTETQQTHLNANRSLLSISPLALK